MEFTDLKNEAGREVGQRKKVYQRWVALGRMEPKEAHERTQNMSVIYRVLKEIEVAETNMFTPEPVRNWIQQLKEQNLK